MLLTELKVFLSQSRNVRALLLTNFIFALVGPVTDLFVSAYVMRNSHDVRLVMSYQMALYTGIPIAFFLNGYLLRIFSIRHLYGLSMILSTLSMAGVMALSKLEITGIAATGVTMGLSIGMYWANRDFLALSSTHDGNRNYYYAMETFFTTLCGLVVPITVGWFISGAELYGWFGGDKNHAYRILTVAVFFLACGASAMICRGDFANPKPTRFIYWRFHPIWSRVLWMSVFRGVGQGFATVLPVMLVMKLMSGQEGMLGVLQTCGTILTAVGVYVFGRVAGPQHRFGMLLLGLTLYFAATVSNAALFSAIGVIVYFLLGLLGRPLIEMPVYLVQFRVIDILEKAENRNSFAYLFNNEFGLYVGRLSGGLLFIGVATLSEPFALRYVLLAIAALQLMMLFFYQDVLKKCDRMEPATEPQDLPPGLPGEISTMGQLEKGAGL